MNKTVVINTGSGDLNKGFNQVIVQIRAADNTIVQQFVGSLPPAPYVIEQYRNWQLHYKALCDRQRLRSSSGEEDDDPLEIDATGKTNVSEADFNDLCEKLQKSMNDWLLSEEFSHASRQLRSHLNPEDEIRIIFETEDELLRRLPVNRSSFYRDYPYAEMALFRPEYQRPPRPQVPKNQVRILAILGNSQGINVEDERNSLTDLQDAEVELIVKPSRQEFDTKLRNPQGWDILFFAGHSATEGSTGKMYINENQTNNSLTIEQLEEALTAAINNGLQLAIFNSCDGLGLARELEKLNIPTIIAMREPVPNRVAQEFFKYFIAGFAKNKKPLYLAVKEARGELQRLEDESPAASWLPVICQNPAVQPPTWVNLGGGICPYRGLYAFREQDAHLFFGREEFTQNLVAAVRKKPLVAVVGPSGSGKSSVVFAGLVPQLKQDTLANWQIIHFRPGNNPIEGLARAFTPLLWFEDENAQRLFELELQVAVEQDSQALYRIIEIYVQQNPGTRLVLIADQFEELYTLAPEEQRQPFLDALLTACNKAPSFTLVITLRADFYGYALSYRPFSNALQGAVLNLGPMSRQELHSAIAKPAAKIQLGLEDGLTNRIVNEIGHEPGRLPLLEFALTQLWEQRENGRFTHQAYNKIGGVSLALGEYAEQVYTQLCEDDRNKAQQVFIQLVRLGEGAEATRRLATRSQVKNWDLVTHLASKRLVVTNRNSERGEETVEIVHEALIKSWGRLEQWLLDNEDFLRWRNRLEDAMGEWKSHSNHEDYLLRKAPLVEAEGWWQKRAEEISGSQGNFIQKSLELRKHHQRNQKLTISGIAVVLLTITGIAVWNWRKAEDSERKANVSEIQAIAKSSPALLASNQYLDALVEAIKAGQKLKKLGSAADPKTRMQVILALREAVYEGLERNRFSGHRGNVYSLTFSPNGKTIASASEDKTIKISNLDGRVLKTLTGHSGTIFSVVFSPNGKTIASASFDRTIKIWNLDGNGSLLKTLTGHKGAVNSVTFSPDGKTIASASEDKTIKIWNLDGSLLTTLTGHKGAVNSVTFSPDGKTIASASEDKTIKLWSLDSGKSKTLGKHNGPGTSVTFSRNGKKLASTSWDGRIKLWNVNGQSTQEITIYAEHNHMIFNLSFSPDGKMLASASADNTIKFWSLDFQKPLILTEHSGAVTSVIFSPDNKTIASASEDKSIKLWSLDGRLLQTLTGHSGAVTSVIFSPDNKTIASASEDKSIKLWSLDGRLLQTLTGHSGAVTSVIFSPDNKTIASASEDKSIKIWSLDGRLLKTFGNHDGVPASITFSTDGKMIAYASSDGTIKLRSLDGGKPKTLGKHDGAPASITFSNDDKMIASGSDNARIKLWSLDGDELKTLVGHSSTVTSLSFSPDNKTLASGSEDNTIKIWSVDGEELSTFSRHKRDVTSLSFSPDGKMLVSSDANNTVILWNLNLDDLLLRGCKSVSNYLRNPNRSNDTHHLCNDIDSSR
ncbi:MAG: CHAT domain-containing protein [Calothrix sp. MO_192.B10]|nr:CHAT domain-containing protein [Calothrix sp. MO_192.B10]